MYIVYAITSLKQKYIYVGLTANLERRIKEHNLGYNKSTKPYRPYKILLTESFDSRREARQRKKYLKSGCGKEYLKSLGW